MARTQKNKATSFHLGTLKAKLAKLRKELITPQGGSGGGGGGMLLSSIRVRNIYYLRIMFF